MHARLETINELECVIITKNILINILRRGLQSPNGGFQEGPRTNKGLKYCITIKV